MKVGQRKMAGVRRIDRERGSVEEKSRRHHDLIGALEPPPTLLKQPDERERCGQGVEEDGGEVETGGRHSVEKAERARPEKKSSTRRSVVSGRIEGGSGRREAPAAGRWESRAEELEGSVWVSTESRNWWGSRIVGGRTIGAPGARSYGSSSHRRDEGS